jgi:hypothetical protein
MSPARPASHRGPDSVDGGDGRDSCADDGAATTPDGQGEDEGGDAAHAAA